MVRPRTAPDAIHGRLDQGPQLEPSCMGLRPDAQRGDDCRADRRFWQSARGCHPILSPLPGGTMTRAQPARFPPNGAWPAVMRADLAAAFFDCPDTKEFFRRVVAGEAPRPCDMIGKGQKREPIWTVE